MDSILEFQQVTSGYGSIRILKDLSFQLNRGETLGIIGPNGCGKTTALNALAGLIFPFSGRIIYEGRDISSLPPNRRCELGIGRTFQVPRPFEGMTVLDNVLVATGYGAGLSGLESEHAAVEALELTGMYEHKDVVAGKLTFLDRKKLEIARALGTRPKLLLLDEVAAGLTEAETAEVMKMVAVLKEQGYTIIWIEHIIDTMVKSTDRLMCMSDGHNVICGDPKEVIDSDIVEELYLGAKE